MNKVEAYPVYPHLGFSFELLKKRKRKLLHRIRARETWNCIKHVASSDTAYYQRCALLQLCRLYRELEQLYPGQLWQQVDIESCHMCNRSGHARVLVLMTYYVSFDLQSESSALPGKPPIYSHQCSSRCTPASLLYAMPSPCFTPQCRS